MLGLQRDDLEWLPVLPVAHPPPALTQEGQSTWHGSGVLQETSHVHPRICPQFWEIDGKYPYVSENSTSFCYMCGNNNITNGVLGS